MIQSVGSNAIDLGHACFHVLSVHFRTSHPTESSESSLRVATGTSSSSSAPNPTDRKSHNVEIVTSSLIVTAQQYGAACLFTIMSNTRPSHTANSLIWHPVRSGTTVNGWPRKGQRVPGAGNRTHNQAFQLDSRYRSAPSDDP